MHKLTHPLIAAAIILAASSAFAATIGTRTITDAAHFSRRGHASNTVSTVVPAASGTVRWITVSGTLTSTNAETWARNLRIQPSGTTSLAGGPGTPRGQGYFQFSAEQDFTGTINVATTIAVPGGINASGLLTFEAYSPDSESFVPGLDGRSTLTYTFHDAIPNGGADFSGALATTDPTYNRATNFNADPDGPIVSGISGVGTNVYYDVQPFHVATSGSYAIALATGFDSHLTLYAGTFDPANALTGFVDANDSGRNTLRRAGLPELDEDNVTNGISRLDKQLTAGVQYYAVTSSYGNGQTGNYFAQIGGAGAVTLGLVPEPTAAIAIMCGGAAIGTRRSRR